MSAYIKAENTEQLAGRLNSIEGQVKGIKRMVDREGCCIDILTEIADLIAASEEVAAILLKDHVDHCVRASIENEDETGEKTEEIIRAAERFLKLKRS